MAAALLSFFAVVILTIAVGFVGAATDIYGASWRPSSLIAGIIVCAFWAGVAFRHYWGSP